MSKLTPIRIFLLCLMPYVWVVGNSWRNFTGLSLAYISIGIAANSLLLAIAYLAVSAIFRRTPDSRGKLAGLAATGALLVSISFAYSFLVFMQWNQATKIGCLPAIALVVYFALRSDRLANGLLGILFAATVLAFIQTSANTHTNVQASAHSSRVDQSENSRQYIQQKAGRPPNIYLLMFDAMSESNYYAQTIGAPPPWQAALLREGFRESTQARSSRPYSMQSVIDVLQERPLSWSAYGEDPIRESAELTIDSPASGITKAHALGYKVAFLYQNNYFGMLHPLQNLDAYEPQHPVGLCSLAPIRVGLHLCQGTQHLVERWMGLRDEVTAHHEATSAFIRKVAQDDSAWIMWSYIAVPEHTSLTYREYVPSDKAEFLETHRRKSLEAVAIMESYLREISARDPSAVIVVFGDHGIIRSRGWSSDSKVQALFSPDQKAVDERGIGLFIKPADFCADRIKSGYKLEKLLTDLTVCTAARSNAGPP